MIGKSQVDIIVLAQHEAVEHLVPTDRLVLSEIRIHRIRVLDGGEKVVQFQGCLLCHRFSSLWWLVTSQNGNAILLTHPARESFAVEYTSLFAYSTRATEKGCAFWSTCQMLG